MNVTYLGREVFLICIEDDEPKAVQRSWLLVKTFFRVLICSFKQLSRCKIRNDSFFSFIRSFVLLIIESIKAIVYSFIHPLLHLLNHSFIHSFIHALIHLCIYTFLIAFIYFFIRSFFYSLALSLSRSCPRAFMLSFTQGCVFCPFKHHVWLCLRVFLQTGSKKHFAQNEVDE